MIYEWTWIKLLMPFNFQEYKDVWMKYFTPTLSWFYNRLLKKNSLYYKQNQDVKPKVTLKNLGNKNQESKSFGKGQIRRNLKSMEKNLDSTSKLILLAEIQNQLSRFANWQVDCAS
jgi:hypothetical protein